jgi:hypothetical protein
MVTAVDTATTAMAADTEMDITMATGIRKGDQHLMKWDRNMEGSNLVSVGIRQSTATVRMATTEG